MITGCTFGKGIIRKSGIGTLGFTLTDRAIGRLVRISCQETLTEKA